MLDVGLDLLRTVRSIPHEANIVSHPEVALFEDDQCTIEREGVVGIMLETTAFDSRNTFRRIFPTTKSTYYQKGKRVSWEWNLSRVWEDTWYVDPDSKEKLPAWSSAGEFVGRHIDEI